MEFTKRKRQVHKGDAGVRRTEVMWTRAGGGVGGGGCFGFGTWEDDANFDARVWDVGSLTNVGTINTDATGQSYLPALVVPIPLIARVEANACSRLATQLKDFVNGS